MMQASGLFSFKIAAASFESWTWTPVFPTPAISPTSLPMIWALRPNAQTISAPFSMA